MILAFTDTLDYNPLEEAWPDSVAKREAIEVQRPDKLQVYLFPNPGSNELYVASDLNLNYIELADFTGRVLYTARPLANFYSLSSAVGVVAKGVYIVRVVVEDGSTYTSKWIKQ